MTATVRPPAPRSAPGDPTALIEAIAEQLRELANRDWVDAPGDGANHALVALEGVNRAFAALQSELINAAEASGLWALEGHRTFASWLTGSTGTTRARSTRAVKLSRALRDFLPHTRRALADGSITKDHAELLARKCTQTQKHRELLADAECGERFLLAAAKELDAGRFAKVAEQWTVMADPQAADRGWREVSAKEEVVLSPTTGGYLLGGWLSTVNGAILEEALTSHMGRKAAGDLRSPKQRRADALVSLARVSLDSGAMQPSARIRPHLTVTLSYETLTALADATRPAFEAPPLFPESATSPHGGSEHRKPPGSLLTGSPEWMDTWVAGGDHVINVGLDYEHLEGMQPATIADGTPLPPNVLSRLACESMIARVVFGPGSTVLDSGRQERIFPAHQVRAIIARDRHCQYPGCDALPGFGEIHHSAEWFKHRGSTHVDLGILLCWHHHALVHERGVTIFRPAMAAGPRASPALSTRVSFPR